MSTKRKFGCFTYPIIIVISGIGSGVISSFVPIPNFYIFVSLLFICSWIFGKIVSSATFFQSRYLIYSFILTIGLFIIKNKLLSIHTQLDHTSDFSEAIYKEKVLIQRDSVVLLSQSRKWKDNYGNSYKGDFSVREKDYFNSKKAYFRYTQNHQVSQWGLLYKHLVRSDTPYLDLILNELSEIKKKRHLNQLEFAEMVVTFIQDIPYSLVFGGRCLPPNQYEDSIRSILEQCPKCCIGNIPYGIQNPVAFMGNLKGDCDTRTVIIYAILDHFGYDVAILNSEYYKHSILGLHIPATGKHKTYRGKRYYTWETTNKHFTIGTLPKNMEAMNHWNIVLTNT